MHRRRPIELNPCRCFRVAGFPFGRFAEVEAAVAEATAATCRYGDRLVHAADNPTPSMRQYRDLVPGLAAPPDCYLDRQPTKELEDACRMRPTYRSRLLPEAKPDHPPATSTAHFRQPDACDPWRGEHESPPGLRGFSGGPENRGFSCDGKPMVDRCVS